MTRKRNQAVWDQWQQRLKKQRGSGLPITAFCRQEGVSQAAFHAWKRRLNDETSGHRSLRGAATTRRSCASRAAARRRLRRQSPPADIALPPRCSDFLQLPVRAAPSSPWIELTLVDGTLVRVPQENLAAFTTLLQVLRGSQVQTPADEARHA
jgi:hypothetical protein